VSRKDNRSEARAAITAAGAGAAYFSSCRARPAAANSASVTDAASQCTLLLAAGSPVVTERQP